MFFTEKKFIDLFHKNNDIKTYFVKQPNKITPLNIYVKNHKISKQTINELKANIEFRDEYLERFYETSLKVYSPISITEQPTPISRLNNNEFVKYKNLIRNLFLKEILQNTKSGLKNVPSYMDVLNDLYNEGIIDYKLLTPSASFYIHNGRIGSVFSSFYFRASIMNPFIVYSLNKGILKGTKIFTPTLGWGSYCYGFMECKEVMEYVGVDVIPNVCKKVVQFGEHFYPERNIQTICTPSEQLFYNTKFMKKYANHFDTVFFSPPYYRLELYQGNQQSTTTYTSYADWLEGYWKTTIKLCFHVLEPNGKLCYIISNYGEQPNLMKDMNTITKNVGFIFKQKIKMANKAITVNKQNDNTETVFIFTKIL
jgi:hypothetical protein